MAPEPAPPAQDCIVPFGRHTNHTLEHILRTDPAYIKYLFSNVEKLQPWPELQQAVVSLRQRNSKAQKNVKAWENEERQSSPTPPHHSVSRTSQAGPSRSRNEPSYSRAPTSGPEERRSDAARKTPHVPEAAGPSKNGAPRTQTIQAYVAAHPKGRVEARERSQTARLPQTPTPAAKNEPKNPAHRPAIPSGLYVTATPPSVPITPIPFPNMGQPSQQIHDGTSGLENPVQGNNGALLPGTWPAAENETPNHQQANSQQQPSSSRRAPQFRSDNAAFDAAQNVNLTPPPQVNGSNGRQSSGDDGGGGEPQQPRANGLNGNQSNGGNAAHQQTQVNGPDGGEASSGNDAPRNNAHQQNTSHPPNSDNPPAFVSSRGRPKLESYQTEPQRDTLDRSDHDNPPARSRRRPRRANSETKPRKKRRTVSPADTIILDRHDLPTRRHVAEIHSHVDNLQTQLQSTGAWVHQKVDSSITQASSGLQTQVQSAHTTTNRHLDEMQMLLSTQIGTNSIWLRDQVGPVNKSVADLQALVQTKFGDQSTALGFAVHEMKTFVEKERTTLQGTLRENLTTQNVFFDKVEKQLEGLETPISNIQTDQKESFDNVMKKLGNLETPISEIQKEQNESFDNVKTQLEGLETPISKIQTDQNKSFGNVMKKLGDLETPISLIQKDQKESLDKVKTVATSSQVDNRLRKFERLLTNEWTATLQQLDTIVNGNNTALDQMRTSLDVEVSTIRVQHEQARINERILLFRLFDAHSANSDIDRSTIADLKAERELKKQEHLQEITRLRTQHGREQVTLTSRLSSTVTADLPTREPDRYLLQQYEDALVAITEAADEVAEGYRQRLDAELRRERHRATLLETRLRYMPPRSQTETSRGLRDQLEQARQELADLRILAHQQDAFLQVNDSIDANDLVPAAPVPAPVPVSASHNVFTSLPHAVTLATRLSQRETLNMEYRSATLLADSDIPRLFKGLEALKQKAEERVTEEGGLKQFVQRVVRNLQFGREWNRDVGSDDVGSDDGGADDGGADDMEVDDDGSSTTLTQGPMPGTMPEE